MSLIQRYILLELTKVFAILVAISSGLLVFVGVYTQAREYDLGPLLTLQILPYVIPSILPFTIPSSLLLAVCVVYGRLSGDREVIAAKAAGISVLTLLWPSLFLASLTSLGTLLVADQAIPWSMAHIERTVASWMEDIFLDRLRVQNQIAIREVGVTITVMEVRGRTLIMPTFRYTTPGNQPVTLQAGSAELSFNPAKQEVLVKLEQGYLDLPGEPRMFIQSEEQPFPLPIARKKPRSTNMSVRQMRDEMTLLSKGQTPARQKQALEVMAALTTGEFERLSEPEFQTIAHFVREEGDRSLRLLCEMHNRFALSCSPLFFVLLGAPFSIWMGRKQFLTSFLFCFVPILVLYYPLNMMAQNLARTGNADPLWVSWLGSGALLVAASALIKQIQRH